MKLDWHRPTPLEYFAALVQSDDGLPLLEAAASLAHDEYPSLDLQQVLSEVDRLAARLRRQVKSQAPAMERLHVLGKFFFGELGFAGNINDYHNPDNSFVHEVLQSRRGIPISLAVLWLELARGLGLNAEGVNFPGHFLVQAQMENGRVVIDPFSGRSLTQGELRAHLEDLAPALLAPFGTDVPLMLFLESAAPRQILTRMLRNLQHIHRTHEDWERVVNVQDRLIVLLPDAWSEYRDRGLALAELGERERARADLSRYLHEMQQARDRTLVLERLSELGGRLS